jgi:hypothetical protein
MEQRKRGGLILSLTSLLALGLGALLFFEIIRPFHDNNIDIPMAIGAAVVGVLLSASALIFRKGALVLNIVALVLNLAALGIVACIIHSLSHMRLI